MLKVYGINIYFPLPPPKRMFCTLSLMLTIMDSPLCKRHDYFILLSNEWCVTNINLLSASLSRYSTLAILPV